MAHIEYFSWSLQNFVFQHSAYWWMSFVFGHSCCHTKFSTQFDEFIHVVIPNFLLSLMNLWNRLRCDYFTAKDKLAPFFLRQGGQCRRASMTTTSLKSGYFTSIISCSVKTVADRQRHAAYHNKQQWQAFYWCEHWWPWISKIGVLMFFCNLWLQHRFQEWLASRWIEIDQDNLQIGTAKAVVRLMSFAQITCWNRLRFDNFTA